jgi:hypothetical protein
VSEPSPTATTDAAALDTLADTVEASAAEERLLARRIRRFRDARAAGSSWRQILADEPRPHALALITSILGRLTPLSGALRRRLVRGLRDEGASVSEIGEQLGVSHQRVSSLLRATKD